MTFQDIIALWPTQAEMAAEVGVTHDATQKWSQRGNIPPTAWAALLATKTARRHKITANTLVAAVRKRSA